MGFLGRRRRQPQYQCSVAPAPANPYAVATGRGVGRTPGGWAPFHPEANANDQIGAYATPYGVPTQICSYWPDIQLKCGVEGMRPWWNVYTPSDVPYFQQTTRPVDPRRALLDGGRPGPQLGPAQVSLLLGPQRQIAAKQLQAVANGLMGW